MTNSENFETDPLNKYYGPSDEAREAQRHEEMLAAIESTRLKKSVTKTRKQTRHGLHLALTLLTGGAWGFVWLGMILWHKLGPKSKAKTTYSY